MSNMNLGSVGVEVHNLVENIPTAISGATLLRIANSAVKFVENYTGQTIGSTAITETYQGPIINITASQVLKAMETVGADVSSLNLGEFSISKGQGSNITSASEMFNNLAMQELSVIGRRVSYYKANG